MIRIRINTHPGYDYSSFMVLDYSEELREFVKDREDVFHWLTGRWPKTIQVHGEEDRWDNLKEITKYCLSLGYEVKARKSRNDAWLPIVDAQFLDLLTSPDEQ